VKKTFLLLLVSFFATHLLAIELSADLFTYDESKYDKEFIELSHFDSLYRSYPDNFLSENELTPILTGNKPITCFKSFYGTTATAEPGKMPSFWFTFAFSSIGTYTLYGAVAGPISVGIVYLSSDNDKIEVRKAIWGCLSGTLIGAGIKYAVVNL
jgi:hypothetical protein